MCPRCKTEFNLKTDIISAYDFDPAILFNKPAKGREKKI